MHELLSGLVGALFVLGSFYITFLLGRVRQCQIVNTRLLEEKTALQEAFKQVQAGNIEMRTILSRPYSIHMGAEQLQTLAAMLGPYLVPNGSKQVN